MRFPLIVPVLALFAVVPQAGAAQNPPPMFESSWGTFGSAPGQFYEPTGLTRDGSGYLYVLDAGNDNVQKFTASGQYVTTWGGVLSGSGNGEFNTAFGIEAGPGDVIYVADTGNNRIQKFTADGSFVLKWGTAGSGNGQMNGPRDVAVDGSGNVYVADTGNHRVQVFNAAGNFVSAWGASSLVSPQGIAFGNGTVYVADVDLNKVVAFSPDGTTSKDFLGSGQAEGQVQFPTAVSVDPTGNILVIDRGSCTNRCRVQRVASDGTVLSVWGSLGTGDGQFETALDVAVIGSSVYVSDLLPRIQQFSFTTPVEPITWGRLKTRY